MLKVYHKEDDSLIEYFSHTEDDFMNISKTCGKIQEYSKFFNKHYSLVAQLEEKVTKHGHPNMLLNEHDIDFDTQIEGINMMQLFSLAKRSAPTQRPKESMKEQSSYESLKK
jgi:hypothetical protein